LAVSTVFDKALPLKSVHEKVDPRAGRADHIRQDALIDGCRNGARIGTFNVTGKLQQSTRQTLFRWIGKVIDEVFLIVDALSNQVGREHHRKVRFIAQ
jgi:hypothetical protein